MEQFEGEICLL